MKTDKMPLITPEDKQWVEENFAWMKGIYGFPARGIIRFDKEYFPATFIENEIKTENLILDFCTQFGLIPELFPFEVVPDIRDTVQVPYQIQGRVDELVLGHDKESGRFMLSFSSFLSRNPRLLVAALCLEFTKAHMISSQINFGDGEEARLFLNLAAVYLGYGLLLCGGLSTFEISADSVWFTRKAHYNPFAVPLMAYSLACFAVLTKQEDAAWKNELPAEIRNEFDRCLHLIGLSDIPLFDKQRINNFYKATELLERSFLLEDEDDPLGGLSLLKQIPLLTDEPFLLSETFNNIGYAYIRRGDFPQAISNLNRALDLNPDHAYALNNLGYALIRTGNANEGKKYLDRCIQYPDHSPAYVQRSLGLFYQLKDDTVKAGEHYKLAYAYNEEVDLLDYHYGLFLIENGKDEEGITCLKKSAEKGEMEAVQYFKGSS